MDPGGLNDRVCSILLQAGHKIDVSLRQTTFGEHLVYRITRKVVFSFYRKDVEITISSKGIDALLVMMENFYRDDVIVE